VKHIPAVSFFLFGLVIGMCLDNFDKFKWKYEVDVTALATILLGVVAALVLQAQFTTKATGGREEKKLLIEQLQRIIVQLDLVRENYIQSTEGNWRKPSSKSAGANLRLLANSIHLFTTSVSHSGGQCDDSKAEVIKELYLNLKVALTSGPYPSKPLPENAFFTAETKCQSLRNEVTALQFQINRQ
jgi:hypothetical protein